MTYIDDIIAKLDTLTDKQRATWQLNAERVIARGPRRNAAYAPGLRLRDAIAAFEATRPDEDALIAACGLDWDRVIAGRTTFRGYAGTRLVARVTRVKPATFAVQVNGKTLARTFTTLSAARAAAAEAHITDVRGSQPGTRAA
ncbi:hypothetical protein [Roseicyclus marinus]|uniref:hypothetical protein n=1 Tax=Roseicyclus marinus TaxID=2161673 RepID=UPI00240F3DFB|nr:hypothetical protein [Roseicyclus marinus]MDG3039819.1 hypothetical protein [Roseicyclus marinus]